MGSIFSCFLLLRIFNRSIILISLIRCWLWAVNCSTFCLLLQPFDWSLHNYICAFYLGVVWLTNTQGKINILVPTVQYSHKYPSHHYLRRYILLSIVFSPWPVPLPHLQEGIQGTPEVMALIILSCSFCVIRPVASPFEHQQYQDMICQGKMNLLLGFLGYNRLLQGFIPFLSLWPIGLNLNDIVFTNQLITIPNSRTVYSYIHLYIIHQEKHFHVEAMKVLIY